MNFIFFILGMVPGLIVAVIQFKQRKIDNQVANKKYARICCLLENIIDRSMMTDSQKEEWHDYYNSMFQSEPNPESDLEGPPSSLFESDR